ncbi:hypothetical protein Tco_0488985 [Tanacetum coccineum]
MGEFGTDIEKMDKIKAKIDKTRHENGKSAQEPGRIEQSSVVTDGPIHSASSPVANHQRFIATGIRVALTSGSTQEPEKSQHDHPPDVVPQILNPVIRIYRIDKYKIGIMKQRGGDVVDLTGDEDLTDEDGDIGMGINTGVLASLGGEIFPGGKKS